MPTVPIEKADEATESRTTRGQYQTAGFWQCFILAIGIASGGVSTSKWQYILLSGMWSGLISALVGSVGFFMVDLCLAELVGVVPFGGGSFGFVRCSMGPFWGFVAASVELVVYAVYTVRTVQKLAQLVTVAAMTAPEMEKVWALCAYVAITCLHLRGGNAFWNTMLGCTVFTLCILSVYIVGSLTEVDFYRYAMDNGNNNGFEPVVVGNSAGLYMQYSYFPMWFYLGICALPLAGQRVRDPHVNIPRAIIASLSTMFVIAMLTVFCVACQTPGISLKLRKVTFILESGLQHVMNIDQKWIAVMLLVPTFASSAGFMFASKHQLASMAESGMVPDILKRRFGAEGIPVYAVLFSAMLQYAIYLAVDHYLITNYQVTFRLCCSAACIMYILLMMAFITFRVKYPSMKRHFVNPCGIVGAVIGIVVFGQILLGLAFFEQGNHASMIALVMYMVLMMVYYFAYVQYVERFSKEEQDKFMKAYILNANKRRRMSKWSKLWNSCMTSVGADGLIVWLCSSCCSSRLSSGGLMGRSSMHQDPNSTAGSTVRASKVMVECSADSLVLDEERALDEKIVGVERKKSGEGRGQGLRISLTWSGKPFEGDDESRTAFQLLQLVNGPDASCNQETGTISGISAVIAEEEETEESGNDQVAAFQEIV